MPPPDRVVAPDDLARWCKEQLGSPPVAEIFRSGHLSSVVGLRLADGREVVVKVRPASSRTAACVEVQRRMSAAGYPCPRPLTGAVPFGSDVATAEEHRPGGADLPSGDDVAPAFAEAFERLLRLAPGPHEVPSLDPPPSWAAWDHGGDGLWPPSEDVGLDLGAVPGARWIDDAGSRARELLRAGRSDPVVGHCDWLASNVRWAGDDLLVVHDWDSVAVDSEAVLVGLAAAIHPSASRDGLATVDDTERFLVAYGRARGRELSRDEPHGVIMALGDAA